MAKKNKQPKRDPLAAVLATFRRRDRPGWDDAWVGMEPTFQSRKSVKKWDELAAVEGGEDAYFTDRYMLSTQRAVARAIAKRYKARRKRGHAACLFDRVTVEEGLDPWKVLRQNLEFKWADEALEDLNVRFTIDPETFEYSIKPVPLAWFYDERWVAFLEDFLWRAPRKMGLEASIAHGGAQFSLSAKTYLQGSLLADDIADKLSHPELSTWIMDWPNPDDRAFRATRQRTAAFRRVLEAYWRGEFHPRALGGLTPENCYLDRGFGPAAHAGLMDRQGPLGDGRAVFQTNFAFARAVRWQAQNVHPGYWQAASPKEEGYRPDQIMRYGEGNLNRLQIAGELHVKSGAVLDPERVPALHAPLDVSMLTEEASWENRGQMGRTSARDFVEALLLEVHNARWLQQNPHVAVKTSLLQDQLLGDGEATVKKHGGERALARLHREARAANLEASSGRIVDDFIEPETLFWAAWRVLPKGDKAAVAREVITAFVERVERAASTDPRPAAAESHDIMEWHRHRIHPVLWGALAAVKGRRDAATRELAAWEARRDEYLARRPVFSQTDLVPPWA